MLYQKTFQKFEIIPALCRAPNMAGPMSSDQLAVQKIVAIDAHEHVAQRRLSMDHAESDAASWPSSDISDDFQDKMRNRKKGRAPGPARKKGRFPGPAQKMVRPNKTRHRKNGPAAGPAQKMDRPKQSLSKMDMSSKMDQQEHDALAALETLAHMKNAGGRVSTTTRDSADSPLTHDRELVQCPPGATTRAGTSTGDLFNVPPESPPGQEPHATGRSESPPCEDTHIQPEDIHIQPGDMFFNNLSGWASVESVLQKLAVVQCDGASLISKDGRLTRRGVTYRYRCGFHRQGCKWLVEVEVLNSRNSHTGILPQRQAKKDRARHHATHVCDIRIDVMPHSNHLAVTKGPLPIFKASANMNPQMLSMTRNDIHRWMESKGVHALPGQLIKTLNSCKKQSERKRRKQLASQAGLPAGLCPGTVGALVHAAKNNSFHTVSRLKTFDLHSPYVVPGSTASPDDRPGICLVLTTMNLILNAVRASHCTPGGLRLSIDHSYMIKKTPNLTVIALGPDGHGHFVAVATVGSCEHVTTEHCLRLVKTHALEVLQFYQSQNWNI